MFMFQRTRNEWLRDGIFVAAVIVMFDIEDPVWLISLVVYFCGISLWPYREYFKALLLRGKRWARRLKR